MKRSFLWVVSALMVNGNLARGQDPVPIGGEGTIGTQTLTSANVGGVDIAAVPGGAWSANGGTGVVESTLNSPVVTVGAAGDVILSFDHRYYFEDDGTIRWDAGAVFVSKNGGEFDYVPETAFTENTYDGAGPGEDGRFITGNSPPLNGFFAFNNQSPGFLAGATIQSVANLGTFAAGDTVQVRFWGAWDEGFIQTPGPNWEVTTFNLSQGGSSLSNVDFSLGPGGFVVGPDFSPASGPWTYAGSAPVVFEINGDTLEADQMVTDSPGPTSVIDLNGVEIIVSVIAGQADVGETFDLFDGGTLQGSYSGITLPPGQWDLSGLEPGGDGTITYASTELGGWRVRALDLLGGGGFEQVNNVGEAVRMIEQTATTPNLNVQSDIETVYDVIDIGDNGGTFPDTQLYPDGITGGHEDIVVRAEASVVIPPGKWTIAFGSDDGGLMTIPGIDFSTGDGGFDGRFNEDFDPNGPIDPERGNDSIEYWKPRGHQWTGGTFELAEPLETTITVTMYERGGGDSLEVAIIDVSDPDLHPFPPFSNADFNAAPGKALLGNGVLGWTVKSGVLRGEAFRRAFIGGMGLVGDQEARAVREDEVFGPPVESPGLTQEWWQNSNPGNKPAVENVFSARSPDNGPFKGTDAGGTGTWWTGNGAALAGVQDYPPATTILRDNYLTRLTGEIFIPESGLYRFKDGVDDFCFLGIDTDGDGAFTGDEVLINDGAWVGVEGVRGGLGNPNSGSPIGEITITVADGGAWLPVEFNTGEGGGGDSGVLYWDYDPAGGGIGAAVGFPEFQDDPIDPAGAGPDLLVPEAHLRSTVAPLLGAALVSVVEGVVVIDFAEDGGHDRLFLTNPDPDNLTAIFDLSGVDLVFNFPGEQPAAGTRFDLLDGGELRGNYRSVTVPEGSNWNLSGLAPGGDGSVVYLGGGVIPQPERFEITEVVYEASPQKVVLTWPSTAGHLYRIEASTDGKDWANWELSDSFVSQGDETTTFEHAAQNGQALPPTLIYRVTDLGIAP